MAGKYCALSILSTLIWLSEVSSMTCPESPSPQLSTTFLDGYWYEHLFTSKILNDNVCSHFEMKCNKTTSSCDVQNVIWHSYLLDELWSGTIIEKDDVVNLTINRGNTSNWYNVNLKFQDEAVLIWTCNATDLEFAAVLIRMHGDEEMEKIWNDARENMNYLSIVDEYPAGIWHKIDPTECTSNGITSYHMSSSNLLVVILLLVTTVREMLM